MKHLRFSGRAFAALLAAAVCGIADAQIPSGYYDSLKGKKGAELKNAVHEIIKNAAVLEYGSGQGHTWYGFYTTDRTDDGMVIDRYSNDERYFTSQGASVSGMNIEHSFPKSWWGGSKNQAYQDLYNLMPCEQKINSSKSNYPMGEVTSVSVDNGCTQIGTGHNGYKLWEPADKWKGDFARGYMYMATAYQNLTWSGTQALQILQQGDYPTLQEWAYKLYIEWAKADVPDEVEVKRNNAVSDIQGNRNPFVDFPNLMEYIWGDSTDVAFNPEQTVQTGSYTGGGGTVTPQDETICSYDFTSADGGCTVENITLPSGMSSIWTLDNKYGWKGTAYYSGNVNAGEGCLVLPEIDLSGYSSATLTFSHAANKVSSPAEAYSVEVRSDDGVTVLSGIQWPKGNTWTFNESGDVSLNQFVGKKIRLVFRYTSTAAEAGTWEIKWLTVKGVKSTSGITGAESDDAGFDFTKPYSAYSVGGQAVNPSSYRGVMILKQGGKSIKVFKK